MIAAVTVTFDLNTLVATVAPCITVIIMGLINRQASINNKTLLETTQATARDTSSKIDAVHVLINSAASNLAAANAASAAADKATINELRSQVDTPKVP